MRFNLQRSVKLDDLDSGRWLEFNQTVFTFVDTLGVLFFGISLAVFYITIKRIARSELSGQNKTLTFLALEVLIVFGILTYAFDTQDVVLRLWKYSGWDDKVPYIHLWVRGEHGHFVDKLHGFIVVFTGWVAGLVLAIRAYILAGRNRPLGILFSLLLFCMFLVQLIFYSTGHNAAVPSHPIINFILQILVMLAILYHAFKKYRETGKIGGLDAIEDILVDSGALFTVGLILQTAFTAPTSGIGFEPMGSVLPHLQNITICTVFVRLIDGVGVGGTIRLVDEGNTGTMSDTRM